MKREAGFAEFQSMAPLTGEPAKQALLALRESRDWVSDLGRMIPVDHATKLAESWSVVDNVVDFQSRVVKPFLESLMEQTTDGVTWNANARSLDEGMLFLSNHRDIVLDPSLVNVALLNHGRGATEIGIGSNLLKSPWINDLVRLNRCFVVERSGSARERYEHSQRTARYIHHVVQDKKPVWLAHREGRAKDGKDTTAPALIRTLSDGCQPLVWNSLKVVPVSISYEWDPCDAFKINELLHLDKKGQYAKQPGEDELSMWTGLVGHKGRVHLEFGDILPWHNEEEDSRKPERDMAQRFDIALLDGMKTWPNQRLAAERLALSPDICALAAEPSDEDANQWGQRLALITETLLELGWSREESERKWCEMLSAPLKLKHSLLHKVGDGDCSGN